MKFLIIVQDLRVAGQSEGVVSRSFLSKLRDLYPKSVIDVIYLKNQQNNDKLGLLAVNTIKEFYMESKIPFLVKWINRIYWRLFSESYYDMYVHKRYGLVMKKLDHEAYDHIFIRSSGLDYETIFGAKDLPILRKAIINFHDPYPLFWYPGANGILSKVELIRLKKMYEVISQSKACITPAIYLSNDMEHLYGSKKKFYTLPHLFSEKVFDLSDVQHVFKKNKKVTISYHGALQFGRNIGVLLEVYEELLMDNSLYKEHTEFVLRLKGQGAFINLLRKKYSGIENIIILDTLNFSNSFNEQKYESDILIILENGPLYSNVLVGKAPLLASLNKPVLCLSPERSEMRELIKDERYIASANDREEVKRKLEALLISRLNAEQEVAPFGDYFGDEKFKQRMSEILND